MSAQGWGVLCAATAPARHAGVPYFGVLQPQVRDAVQAGKEPAPDGHDFDDLVWIRAMRDDRPELYGVASHPQENGLEPSSGTALKMI